MSSWDQYRQDVDDFLRVMAIGCGTIFAVFVLLFVALAVFGR